MTARRLRLRVQDFRRRLRDRAYARLATLSAGPLRHDDEAAAVQLFRDLADREAAEGTPFETVLGRLPPNLTREIRLQFGVILAGEKGLPEKGRAGARGGVR